MRLMIIDDDEDLSRLLASILRRQWPEVQIARYGTVSGALAAWKDARADVMIVDWMLPDGTGLDLIRQVRIIERSNRANVLEHAYCLVHTSKTAERDLAEALDAGADDYLGKPARAMELRARMQVGFRIAEIIAFARDSNGP